MHAAFGDLPLLFHRYGAAALFALLFLEGAGVPVPGELALVYAAYQAQVLGGVSREMILLAGIAGSFLGQTAGYGWGRYGRRWAERGLRLGMRLTSGRNAALTAYFERHGAVTILFARFVSGLRFLAGPVAGVYRMRWRVFLLFNLLGAIVWVAAVSEIGRLLGLHGSRLVRWMSRADLVILAIAAVAIAWAWRRLRRPGRPRKGEGDGNIESIRMDRTIPAPAGRSGADGHHRSDL